MFSLTTSLVLVSYSFSQWLSSNTWMSKVAELFLAHHQPCHKKLHPNITTMAITILAPAPAVPYNFHNGSGSDSDPEDGGVDLEGDSDMRPAKRARHSSAKDLVTPGETVTDDPQWMRYVISLFSICVQIKLILHQRSRHIHRIIQHRNHRNSRRRRPENQ